MEQLKRIDLNLFKVFDAIYQERNLTRAAERLSITQPAVSNALARMRCALNDPLFVKTSRSMQPTAFAESASKHVSLALLHLDQVTKLGSDFAPVSSERLFNINLLDLHSGMVLPELMKRLSTQAPKVRIRIVQVPRQEIRQALINGTLDVASDIPLKDVSELIAEPLAQEDYVCALRPGHPLLSQPLDLDGYLSLNHIHVSARPLGVGSIDVALRRLGLTRTIGLHLQSYSSAAATIHRTDMGMTILRSWAEVSGLVGVTLPIDLAPFRIQLYRHQPSEGDAAVDWIFRQIVNATVSSTAKQSPYLPEKQQTL